MKISMENLVKMQSDYPVESVSWWSVLVFANKLSERHGLKPVYDLSDDQLGNQGTTS